MAWSRRRVVAETTRVFTERDVRRLVERAVDRGVAWGIDHEHDMAPERRACEVDRVLEQGLRTNPPELTEEVIARSRVDLLIALVLTEEGLWSTAWGELIPQPVWDKAHEDGLVRGGRDFTGEGTMFLTPKGRELLADALREGRS